MKYMKREVALKILPMLQEAFSLVDSTASICKDMEVEADFLKYKRQAAQVMGEMYFLMEGIYKEFPDLMPDSFKG